jgi:hypothetical protein
MSESPSEPEVHQLTPPTDASMGTWCRIDTEGYLILGVGPAGHVRSNADGAGFSGIRSFLSPAGIRKLIPILIDAYPLEALSMIPGADK